MAGPMTPERLADLHDRYDGLDPDAYAADHPAAHVLELLAEVDRLQDAARLAAADELTRMGQSLDLGADLWAEVEHLRTECDGKRARAITAEARVAELEAERETWSDVTHAIHVAQQRAERAADPVPDTSPTD